MFLLGGVFSAYTVKVSLLTVLPAKTALTSSYCFMLDELQYSCIDSHDGIYLKAAAVLYVTKTVCDIDSTKQGFLVVKYSSQSQQHEHCIIYYKCSLCLDLI